ncbi:MAG: CCA tRNA nucleotidyltransferase [Dehalococcoidia bacterium]|nr:CCA tRNA nucleotidyltransferase [Dehalococcoidia bacterium]MSQ34655.1 CCA tRNA nucleotidyltransferase [Dehalococcoidia bacterium]
MPNAHQLLEKMLSREMLAALRAAGQMAIEPGAPATEVYLVGGAVRDVYMGVRPLNLDLSVVGDGEAFARHITNRLGGKLEATSEFGTARVTMGFGEADVVTARFETYPAPGALPRVTPAGIREDLARRDFTVNAMAVALWPAQWGDVLDPQRGSADIIRRQLRVLHDRSFQDDATRILRGLRYEARLGLKFDPHALGLIARDLEFIGLISPARIRAELQKLLAEPARALALRRAAELGVLDAIHPGLKCDRRVSEAIEKRQVEGDRDRLLHDLALLTASLTEGDAKSLIARLDPPTEWRDVITAGPKILALAPMLESGSLSPSEAVGLLAPLPLPVIYAQRDIAPPGRLLERLDDYLTKWRHIQPACDGNDLINAGVPQGPAVGLLLGVVRVARLDGRVRSKDEELALVRQTLPAFLRHLP